MILTMMLSNMMNGMAIIISADNSIVIFCLKVMALSLTNSSKCFLYSFVPLNQTSNFFDPLTKHTEAKSRNGVVGSSGKITPNIPRPMKIKPSVIYINFLMFLILLTLLANYCFYHNMFPYF